MAIYVQSTTDVLHFTLKFSLRVKLAVPAIDDVPSFK